MVDYLRALKYPIAAWVMIDTSWSLLAIALPAIGNISSWTIFFLIVGLGIGGWVGYKVVEFKGKLLDVIVAGLIIGAVCFVLDITETGLVTTGTGAGLYNPMSELPYSLAFLFSNFVGAFTAGGFALTK